MADNASNYPGAVDTFTARAATMNLAARHGDDHDKLRDAVKKIEAELGTSPSSAYNTVAIRLNDMQNDIATNTASIVDLLGVVPTVWTNWSPTVGGLTQGNGSFSAAHYTVGEVTFCYYRFIMGTTSAVSGDLNIETPTAMFHAGATGGGYFRDVTDVRYPIRVESITTFNVVLRPLVTSGTFATTGTATSATVPFTWTDNDEIVAFFWYRPS